MLVKQAEFARMKGVSRKTVTQWKSEGRLRFSGNLVDVEASQQRLLSTATNASVGKRADLQPLVTSGATARTSCGQVTTSAVPADTGNAVPNADVPTRAVADGTRAPLAYWPDQLRFAYSLDVGAHARMLAELTLPHLSEPVVRALVAAFCRAATRDAAECLAMDVAVPAGLASWADDPGFGRTDLPADEWDEVLADLAAGTLPKVGADA